MIGVDWMVVAARLVLAVVFAVAGLAKLTDRDGTRALAKDFGVPASLSGLFAWFLPVAELGCAVALVPSATATWGAYATLAMLLLFIAAIGVNLARGRRPDCRCFGQIHSEPVGWNTIARNVVLSALALFVILQGTVRGQPVVASVGGGLSRGALEADGGPLITFALLAILAAMAFGALAMTYLLLRQNGRLALRIEALEARLGPELAKQPGLALDTVAPKVPGAELGEGSVLLFFKSAGCGACESMLPEVEGWQREYHGRLRIVTVDDLAVSEAYFVEGTPSAVLVVDGRVASPLAAGADAIRSLVTSATLPPPYEKGDLVASLTLKDLDGRPCDLGQLAGRRTVLLFWSPTCGFCTDALDDVKWWERHHDPRQADLIVITSGDVAANRAQGFQSRVLLDPEFVAGARFGSGGTPSAVIVDELGRVGSAVAVGAPEVLALAGSASPAREGSNIATAPVAG